MGFIHRLGVLVSEVFLLVQRRHRPDVGDGLDCYLQDESHYIKRKTQILPNLRHLEQQKVLCSNIGSYKRLVTGTVSETEILNTVIC